MSYLRVIGSISILLFLSTSAALGQQRVARLASYVSGHRNSTAHRNATYRDPAVQLREPASAPRAPVYVADPPNIKPAEYNYRYALTNPSANSVKIKINLDKRSTYAQREQLFAYVDSFELKNCKDWLHRDYYPVTIDEHGDAYIEIPSLKTDSMYGFDVHLIEGLPEEGKQAKAVHSMGRYYAATVSDDPVSQARHKIVTTGLLENYDWKLGRRGHHNVNYNQCSGGWCGMFQTWLMQPFVKVWGEQIAPGYQKRGKWYQASALSRVNQTEAVHGNWGMYNYHKTMILGYCEKANRMYSLDGNYGNNVGIRELSPPQLHKFGHITPEMVWDEALNPEEVPRIAVDRPHRESIAVRPTSTATSMGKVRLGGN